MPIYDISGNMIYSGVFNPSFAGSDCRNAFIAEMNKKAAGIGMASSNFITPSGATVNEYTTAKDMALLTMIASGYRQLAEVWSKNSYTITPRGGTAVTVNSTVQDATLEAAYPILGGKTGSISGHRNLACLCNVNGEQVAGYIAGASSDAARFSAMKQLMDIAADVLEGNTPSGSVTDATSAMAIRVPTYYPMNYEQQPADELYAQNENTSIVPASTTKILASLVLLDWVDDIGQTFKFVAADEIGGSGAVFSAGDVISFRDALYAIMLPSSNMTAEAVSRVVGSKILTLGS